MSKSIPDRPAAAQRKTEERRERMKRKIKYTSDMPRLLYTFFISHSDTASAPSFEKFAKSIGATLADLERFRKKSEFERAWRECNEIRRDYLIDSALTRRFDPSLVKFLLAAEFGMGETDKGDGDNSVELTLRVLGEDKNEA